MGLAKVKHLDETYPRLLDKIPEAIPSMNLTTDSSRWDVDWKTVTKTAEVISGEIVLDELIKKLMRIVLENAGAQSGCLILNRDDSLFVAATGTSGTESFDPPNPPWQGGLLDPANPPWHWGLLDPPNPPWQGGLLDPANPPWHWGLLDPANPPWQGGLLDPPNPPWHWGLLDPPNPPWHWGLLDPANPPWQGGLL
ncbi:hypothetical protein, partial [Microseira sp. BLCC-F43]|uniref:hypothetical protein n=1 Tax=Microseira sp. BLCC-F43 TaxID=3153602 RepID=UPI0035BAABC5